MADNISLQDVMDILTVLVERTNEISDIKKEMKNIKTEMKNIKTEMNDHFREIDVKLETKVEPTLQLILENQSEIIKEKSHITVVESKQEELKDRVDVIEYAVKQNQSDIEELKKRA